MASCSSEKEDVQGEMEDSAMEDSLANPDEAASDTSNIEVQDTTAWPDETENSADMGEAADEESSADKGATDSGSEPEEKTEVVASTAKNEEVEEKTAPKEETAPKAASTSTASTSTKEASTKPESTPKKSSGSASSTTALTKKLNEIYNMKVSIGDKLDCMRVQPIAKIDRVKAGQLHDKYVGILPQMLPWVRFEDHQSRILKTDPEKLEKLNTLSDKWLKSYKSIDNQANEIMKKYKQSDFYGDCIN